jgi:hypothetical protein
MTYGQACTRTFTLTIALVSDDKPAILLTGMLGYFVRCVFLEFLSSHFDDSLNTHKSNDLEKETKDNDELTAAMIIVAHRMRRHRASYIIHSFFVSFAFRRKNWLISTTTYYFMRREGQTNNDTLGQGLRLSSYLVQVQFVPV